MTLNKSIAFSQTFFRIVSISFCFVRLCVDDDDSFIFYKLTTKVVT